MIARLLGVNYHNQILEFKLDTGMYWMAGIAHLCILLSFYMFQCVCMRVCVCFMVICVCVLWALSPEINLI